MFRGSIVALITPFKNGEVDEGRMRALIERQIKSGTHGIVPCGTTGESATLSHEEHERVISLTVETVGRRAVVIAGTGSNSTAEAIRLTKYAKKAGADGALLITPYYNRPTQEGLYQHFKKVASEVDIPMVVYNVPSRTGVNLLPETLARLASIDNIVGVKEASGSLQQVSDMIGLCGDKITVLSGDDFATLPILAVGGKGVISVTANIVPADVAELVNHFEAGNIKKAMELHYKLRPLNQAMFYETNPIPVKTAASLLGLVALEFRLPLTPMASSNLERLKISMKDYGLL